MGERAALPVRQHQQQRRTLTLRISDVCWCQTHTHTHTHYSVAIELAVAPGAENGVGAIAQTPMFFYVLGQRDYRSQPKVIPTHSSEVAGNACAIQYMDT